MEPEFRHQETLSANWATALKTVKAEEHKVIPRLESQLNVNPSPDLDPEPQKNTSVTPGHVWKQSVGFQGLLYGAGMRLAYFAI